MFGLGWVVKVFDVPSLPADMEYMALGDCGKIAALFQQEHGRAPGSWDEFWQPYEDFADLRARITRQKGYRLEDRYFFPEKPLVIPRGVTPRRLYVNSPPPAGSVLPLLRFIPQMAPGKPLRPPVPYWDIPWIHHDEASGTMDSGVLRFGEKDFQTLLEANHVTIPPAPNVPPYDPVSSFRLPASHFYLFLARWWPAVYGGIIILAALFLIWRPWKDARPTFFYTALSFSIIFSLIACRAVRGYCEPFDMGAFLVAAIMLALAGLSGRSLIRLVSLAALAAPAFLFIALTIDPYWMRRLLAA